MEFDELVSAVQTFNTKNVVNTPPVKKYKSNSNGNRYELDQFNWTMKRRNYRQTVRNKMKGITVKPVTKVNTLDKLQELLNNNALSQKWSRLEKHHKLQKLNEYMTTFNLSGEFAKKIKIFVYTKFKQGKLKSAKSVVYDSNKYIIKNIPIVDEYLKTLV
tara:strand:+ start:363 stop:842 length:480 start_codon:yes stop_codon:yes gene_type:complete